MLATLFLSVALSADPLPIRLPELAVPTPMPRPASAVSKLSGDQFYIVDSDVPVMVIASPEGVVSITEDSGPLKLKGKFADGKGGIETRTYAGKYIFTIEAVMTGKVEIIVIKQGSGETKSTIHSRRTLDVTAGEGPRPPPPGPTPDPKPDPTPNKVEKLRVIVTRDAGNMSPEVSLLTTDLPFWKSLSDKGHVWRFYHNADADAAPYVADAGGKDAVLIYDNANTKTPLKVIPLPAPKATVEAAVKEFSK